MSALKFPAHRLLEFDHSNRFSFSSTDLYEFLNNYLAKPSRLILLLVIWCLFSIGYSVEVKAWRFFCYYDYYPKIRGCLGLVSYAP